MPVQIPNQALSSNVIDQVTLVVDSGQVVDPDCDDELDWEFDDDCVWGSDVDFEFSDDCVGSSVGLIVSISTGGGGGGGGGGSGGGSPTTTGTRYASPVDVDVIS